MAGTETDHLAKLINEKAEEIDAACIVMASHGKTSFQVLTYLQSFMQHSPGADHIPDCTARWPALVNLSSLSDTDQEGSVKTQIGALVSASCTSSSISMTPHHAVRVLR